MCHFERFNCTIITWEVPKILLDSTAAQAMRLPGFIKNQYPSGLKIPTIGNLRKLLADLPILSYNAPIAGISAPCQPKCPLADDSSPVSGHQACTSSPPLPIASAPHLVPQAIAQVPQHHLVRRLYKPKHLCLLREAPRCLWQPPPALQHVALLRLPRRPSTSGFKLQSSHRRPSRRRSPTVRRPRDLLASWLE